MIEDATVVTTEGLEALVSALSRVGSDDESDQSGSTSSRRWSE